MHLLQVKEKPKLSAEEARKQAEEVLRKAKQKREVSSDIAQRMGMPSDLEIASANPSGDPGNSRASTPGVDKAMSSEALTRSQMGARRSPAAHGVEHKLD